MSFPPTFCLRWLNRDVHRYLQDFLFIFLMKTCSNADFPFFFPRGDQPVQTYSAPSQVDSWFFETFFPQTHETVSQTGHRCGAACFLLFHLEYCRFILPPFPLKTHVCFL